HTAVAAHPYALGLLEVGRGGRAPIAAIAGDAVAGHGGHDAGRVEAANAVVVLVIEVESVGRTHEQRLGLVQLDGGAGAAAVEAEYPGARHGGDDPRPVDLADPVVGAVGDVEVPGGIERRAVGPVDLGRGG